MKKLHKIKFIQWWQRIKVKLKGDAENINKVTKEAKNAMIESDAEITENTKMQFLRDEDLLHHNWEFAFQTNYQNNGLGSRHYPI